MSEMFGLSHGVFLSPFLSVLEILGVVVFEEFGDFWDQRVIWVGIAKQRTDGQQNLGDGQGWRPLGPQNV